MRKKIFLGILITLVLLPVFVSASRIPEPPHLGLWIERDGKLLAVKTVNFVEKVGIRGFPVGKELREVIFNIEKPDRILFFFGSNPAETASLSYLKFVDVVGNPYSGMHRIDMLSSDGTFPFKVNPLGIVRGVPLYEIIIDFDNDFMIGHATLTIEGIFNTAYILQYGL